MQHSPQRPFVPRRPHWVLGGALLLVALAVPGLLRLRLDNAAEKFFVQDAAALDQYRRFEMDFGRDRAVRLVLRGEGLWSPDGIRWMETLEEQAARLPGVMGAGGLVGHHRRQQGPWPPAGETLRLQATGNALDRNVGWISADGSVVTVLVMLYRLPPEMERRTYRALETLLTSAPPGVEGTVAGLGIVQQALDREIIRLFHASFPALGLVTVLLLLFLLRNPRDVARPLVLVTVVQLTVLGIMGWVGATLDLVLILLVPLVFVVTLATAVHLEMGFRRQRRRLAGAPVEQTTAATLEAKGWAVVWTGVTTAIGFGSLVVAPVPAVRALGAWSFCAFLGMTVAALTLMPALFVTTGASPGEPATLRKSRLRRVAPWLVLRLRSPRQRRWTVTLFGLAAVTALLGAPRLELQGSLLPYLSKDHPVRQELESLTAVGLGVVAVDLVLTAPKIPFDSPSGLEALADLTANIRSESRFLGVVSIGDLAADLRGDSTPTLEHSWQEALLHLRGEPTLQPLARFFLNLETPGGSRARITLLVPMAGHDTLEPELAKAEALAADAFPGATLLRTGRYSLLLEARRTLLRTLVTSLAVTVFCFAVLLRLLLGSLALALRALVPNLWPVAMVIGGMGWAGFALDPTTVMVAAAALGLAMDDTLHTLGSFRRYLGNSATPDSPTAARRSLRELLPAHATTSLLLLAGFAVCALADFPAVSRFAALTLGAVTAALLADLGLAPALLAGASPDEVRQFGARPAQVGKRPR